MHNEVYSISEIQSSQIKREQFLQRALTGNSKNNAKFIFKKVTGGVFFKGLASWGSTMYVHTLEPIAEL